MFKALAGPKHGLALGGWERMKNDDGIAGTGDPWHQSLAHKLLTLCVLFLSFVVFFRTAWIADDALISARHVMNFVTGRGLGFNLGERAQAYTHTTWFFLLSGLTAVSKELYASIYFAGLALSLGVVFYVMRLFRYGAALVVLLLCSQAYVDFTNSGLENPLSFALILALIALTWRHEHSQQGQFGIGLCLGLLILTRPDLGVFLVGYALFAIRRHNIIMIGLGLLPLAAWELFSLYYYGTIFPNSAIAKLSADIPRHHLFDMGIEYLRYSTWRDPLTSVVIALFLAASLWRWRLLWLSFAIVMHLAFTVYVGGDFMAGRFLTIPFFASVIGLGILSQEIALETGRQKALALMIFAGLILAVGHSSFYPNFIAGASHSVSTIPENGIADERAFYFQRFSLFRTLHDTHLPDVSAWYAPKQAEAQSVFVLCALLGTFGLEKGPDVHMIDWCGLSDPFLARLPSSYGALENVRSGHFPRAMPDGYEEAVLANRSDLTDPRYSKLYADVHLVTRAPLTAHGRAAAIWRLTVGHD